MTALFAQSIIQFAPLRTFVRIHTNTPHTQLIRELFPKALFNEHEASYEVFIEIAWSFLSMVNLDNMKTWRVDQMILHRIGGLPAMIWMGSMCEWCKNGECHRDDKDLRTGLTLPAKILNDGSQYWCQDGKFHRVDKDPRTGLTLPAFINIDNSSQHWYKDGKWHRVDKDPQSGLTLPAIISMDGSKLWYTDGKWHRVDKDPQTGLTLPAIICADGSQYWCKGGNLYTSIETLDKLHANI